MLLFLLLAPNSTFILEFLRIFSRYIGCGVVGSSAFTVNFGRRAYGQISSFELMGATGGAVVGWSVKPAATGRKPFMKRLSVGQGTGILFQRIDMQLGIEAMSKYQGFGIEDTKILAALGA